MIKQETLRGRGSFARLYAAGIRHERRLVRCCVLEEPAGCVALRVGFAVSAAKFGAAERNRVRRLMREAFRLERDTSLRIPAGRSISLLFTYKGGTPVSRIDFVSIQEDIAALCRAVAATT